MPTECVYLASTCLGHDLLLHWPLQSLRFSMEVRKSPHSCQMLGHIWLEHLSKQGASLQPTHFYRTHFNWWIHFTRIHFTISHKYITVYIVSISIRITACSHDETSPRFCRCFEVNEAQFLYMATAPNKARQLNMGPIRANRKRIRH